MLYYKTIAPSTLGLLKKLQKTQGLTETRLVGGTALALQIGHRLSVDLDLFAYCLNEDFISIIAALKAQGCKLEIRKQTSNILISMIDGVKVDIVNYPYKWLDKAKNEDNITLSTTKDIAAMKLSAITNRGTKKDFIDLFYLLNSYSLKQMLQYYSEKYDHASAFMVLKSLAYFDDAENDVMPQMFDDNINWSAVKTAIAHEVNSLV